MPLTAERVRGKVAALGFGTTIWVVRDGKKALGQMQITRQAFGKRQWFGFWIPFGTKTLPSENKTKGFASPNLVLKPLVRIVESKTVGGKVSLQKPQRPPAPPKPPLASDPGVGKNIFSKGGFKRKRGL